MRKPCGDKGTMMVETMEIVRILMAKSQSARGASDPNCLTLIHTC